MNDKAYRAALDSISASLDAAYALLPDEDEDEDDEGGEVLVTASPQRLPVACKHKHKERSGGFGGAALGWICVDCGATGTGG